MRRSIPTAALSLTLAAVPAAPAAADRSDCKPSLERTYRVSYGKVAKLHGTRAPGRNIRKHGVLFRRVVFDTTCGELRRSTRQLKRLLTAPAYSTLVRTSGPPPQPPAGVYSAGVTGNATLRAIAQCESGGNPRAVSPGGQYRGLLQFDYQTWQSVGGTGDPAAASVEEQYRRGAILYAQRGSAPWPVCGR